MTRSRTELLAEVDQLLKKQTLSREDSARAEQMLALADSLTDRGELRRATTEARNRELGRVTETPESRTDETREFRNYLTAMDARQVTELERQQQRALSTTTTAGGYLVPAGFAPRVELAMANADGIFRACTTFQTDRGSSFVYPIVDDSTAYATIIAENATSNTSADVTFAKVDFGKCPMWRSGMVPVSWELIQDSPFDIETVLADTFGKRLARGIGRWLVLMLQASAPVAVNAASPTVVTGDELENLLDLLPEDHQQNASWLMRQSTLNAIHKLKASTGGSYLFPPAQNPAGQELLMGRPVFASPSMDALTDVGFPIAFGNLGAVVRRVVSGSLAIKAFPERNAEYGENTFESYLRSDGALLATSTNIPVVLLEASGGS